VNPHFGHTRSGVPVHLHTHDFHPASGWYQKFNRRIALWMFRNVGTMTAFWVTLFLCLCALPAVLFQMHIVGVAVVFTGYGFYLLLTWGISTTFQAVMLPGLMVGQNLQNEASDARAEKQFNDTEVIADRLDLETQGGLQVIEDHLRRQDERFDRLERGTNASAPNSSGH
jgi:hypothetical protein